MATPPDPLHEAARRRLAPGALERAAAWTGAARPVARSEREEHWLVTPPGQREAFELWIWPEEREWSCSCEHEACIHLAAALHARRAPVAEAAPLPLLRYHFRRHPQGLILDREVPPGALRRPEDDQLNHLAAGWWGRPGFPKGLLADVLGALRGRPVTLDGQPVQPSGETVLPRVVVDDAEGGWLVRLARAPGIKDAFHNGAVLIEVDGTAWLRPIGDVPLAPELRARLIQGVRFRPDELEKLVTRFLPELRAVAPVVLRTKRLPETVQVPPRLHWEVRAAAPRLRVTPRIVYGEPPLARVERGQLVRIGGPVVVRDLAAEKRLERELSEAGGFASGVAVEREGAAAALWAEGLAPAARERVLSEAPAFRIDRRPLAPRVEVREDGEDFRVIVHAEGARAEHIAAAWEQGATLVPVAGGGYRPVPREWLERHGALLSELLAARDGEGRVSRSAAPMLLDVLDELGAQVPAALGALRALAGDFDAIPPVPLPPLFRGTLRAYQQRGVDWLSWLRSVGMGGVLADDMGLGKTVQCLAAVAVRLAEAPGRRMLVIAPTSVVRNWEAEARRFLPGVAVNVYHGPRRALDPTAPLTLTTWALLRLDVEALAAVEWDLVLCDEAQAMKNPDSQAAQAARRLQAGCRLAVTGTPVENRLDELWSLFQFVNPGLLGTRASFRDRFAGPIAQGSRAARDQLRRRIRPFVLRRLKREVARELPPRTDVVLRCTLSEREREVYDSVRALARADVAKLLAGGRTLQVLETLLRMRQAACHLGLLPGGTGVAGEEGFPTSAKLSLLLDELDEVVNPEEGGEQHRALVFSQWTSMLDLVEPALRARGIPFVRLDGSTLDRAGVVARFNAEDGPPVFLLSLTAGGTGLNLVAADYVFHLDPWWNPAVEDQATDRAHRIGQTRPVVSCRLVAEDTVEERILELQARKRDLAAAALDDAALAQGLSRDDLLALFD